MSDSGFYRKSTGHTGTELSLLGVVPAKPTSPCGNRAGEGTTHLHSSQQPSTRSRGWFLHPFSHEKENKTFYLPRRQKGANWRSDWCATNPCPTEWHTISQRAALALSAQLVYRCQESGTALDNRGLAWFSQFWLLHKNAVGFKWRNSSESALKIAKFHGSARYHHKQRRTFFPRS